MAVLLRNVITFTAFYKMKFGILLYFEFYLFWKKRKRFCLISTGMSQVIIMLVTTVCPMVEYLHITIHGNTLMSSKCKMHNKMLDNNRGTTWTACLDSKIVFKKDKSKKKANVNVVVN